MAPPSGDECTDCADRAIRWYDAAAAICRGGERAPRLGHPGQRGHAPTDSGGAGHAGLARSGSSAGPPRPRCQPTAGEAVRAWGRLGYPRRALRLHDCAWSIVDASRRRGARRTRRPPRPARRRGVHRPAVAAFAYGQRHPVVDTNVRRVIARAAVAGRAARRRGDLHGRPLGGRGDPADRTRPGPPGQRRVHGARRA